MVKFICGNILSLSSFSILVIFTIYMIGQDTGKVYDCRYARWHPDIPNEVRDECSRLQRNIDSHNTVNH